MSKHRPRKSAELYRDEDAYTVVVDLPSFEREDIDVSWSDGRLSVRARQITPAGAEHVYNRSFGVPRPVDATGIEAELEEGVLEVTLPVVTGRTGTARCIDVV